MPEIEKQKTRTSYPKELRSEANFKNLGLVTVSVTFPDGSRQEHQMVADLDECQFAKWAMVLLGREDVRAYPDLEELVRRTCEERGITE